MTAKDGYAVMGKITSVYGVKGWVKVFSYMQPKENICRYKQWRIDRGSDSRSVQVLQCKPHGNGLVAEIEGCNDRDKARELAEYLISVPIDSLPELDAGDYYWHELVGLQVRLSDDRVLGVVNHLIETGANDVLVVRKCAGSIDGKERLIPYLPEQVVQEINLAEGWLRVDWDPEF